MWTANETETSSTVDVDGVSLIVECENEKWHMNCHALNIERFPLTGTRNIQEAQRDAVWISIAQAKKINRVLQELL